MHAEKATRYDVRVTEIKGTLAVDVGLIVGLGLFPSISVQESPENSSEMKIQGIIVASYPDKRKGVMLLSDGLLRRFRMGKKLSGNLTLPISSSFLDIKDMLN